MCSPAELGNKEARAAWLSPFELSEATEAEPVPGDRASNKGCLPMSFARIIHVWVGCVEQARATVRLRSQGCRPNIHSVSSAPKAACADAP